MPEQEYLAVYRLSTSHYKKGDNLVSETKLTKLKRKSHGYDPLQDEVNSVGTWDVLESLDIQSRPDGLYKFVIENYSRCYEYGEVDYDIGMYPYKEEEELPNEPTN